jgi:hypothetical protein
LVVVGLPERAIRERVRLGSGSLERGQMVEVGDSVTSPDGVLKVTLTAFDPRRGEGRLKIEELKAERGRFYVTWSMYRQRTRF